MKKEEGILKKFFQRHKRLPSYREMQDLLGYASKGSVAYCVNKLVEAGFLTRSKGKIVCGPSFFGIHRLGTIEAGFPTMAEEDLSNLLTLDELLIENREATYLLSVKGDSMKDAGILEGDLVLIDRTGTAKPGVIVVAEVDGEYTLKYLRSSKGRWYLEPANAKYKPIYPEGELLVQGVVTAVIRKY